MPNKQILNLLLFSFISAITISLTHAADDPAKIPTNLVGSVSVPEGLSMDGTQKAIIKAALGRRWEIKEKAEGRVVIHLLHRGYDSTLTFLYSAKDIKIYSDSWTVDKRGVKKKKKEPEGWIENLKKDLPVFMNRELYE